MLASRGEKPVIKRTSAGLAIELRGVRLKQREEIEALVALGQLLLQRGGGAAARPNLEL